MIKSLLTILIGLLTCSAFGQVYHPLIRPNTYWDIQHVIGPNICTYISGDRYYFQGDTTILGDQFKILRRYPIVNVNPGPYCPPYAVDISISGISPFCMREDTTTKKVYIYTINSEYDLLFDFSLNAGDTLKSQYAGQGLILIVDSVRTITLINGGQRKIFYLNNSEYYIEGIGGSQGLCFPLCQAIGGYEDPKCVKENGIDLWGSYCGFGYLGINENKCNPSLLLSPNPVKDFLQIKLEDNSNCIINIFDLTGRRILTQSYYNRTEFIDISFLTAGTYIYKFVYTDKEIVTGKFIKIE